jgi:hypothetical protein
VPWNLRLGVFALAAGMDTKVIRALRAVEAGGLTWAVARSSLHEAGEQVHESRDKADETARMIGESATKVQTTASISETLYEVTEDLRKLMSEFVFARRTPAESRAHEQRRQPRTHHDVLRNGARFEALSKDISLSGLRRVLCPPGRKCPRRLPAP